MAAKSSNLFHFTKSINYLKEILREGFRPRYCIEDLGYINIDFFAFPMTCFCDIPISRISEHTAFYRDYGVGMTKEWGLKNHLVPLIYTPPSGPIVDLATYLISWEFPRLCRGGSKSLTYPGVEVSMGVDVGTGRARTRKGTVVFHRPKIGNARRGESLLGARSCIGASKISYLVQHRSSAT